MRWDADHGQDCPCTLDLYYQGAGKRPGSEKIKYNIYESTLKTCNCFLNLRNKSLVLSKDFQDEFSF